MIFKCKGKVIVTGVGKSGNIAQKIAATLVSTGTTAMYLHPTEGMHGSLGVVRKDDVILAVGKSGESEELLGILGPIKKIGAKVISITANLESTLAKNSDIILYTPIKQEACPLDLIPTNSTTAALVIGDAIAVTLMKMRKFKSEDFGLLHPGGIIGKRLLLTVGDIMRSGEDNPTILLNDSIKNMLIEITKKRCGAVSVIAQNQKLLGFITDYDIRKILEKKEDIFSKKIKDIMNPKPIFVYSGMKAVDVLAVMQNREKAIVVLPVINRKKKVTGIIHMQDILAKGL
ncbi:MAG: KpsF/GutQ family sugar-phosphate isomerase [Elusimicrobia bacterium CG06_land_8_20_14_3_00_38_11]|nr:MAG: KpsF/GutQ family sugar-phosphate isomerase [Elusimicrobia bacterium CG06_land_8_20_14_3_00_38_11]